MERGASDRGRGQVKLHPYTKKGGGKGFSHAEGGGGHTNVGVVLTWQLEV